MIARAEQLIAEFTSALQAGKLKAPRIKHFLIRPPHKPAEMRAMCRDDCYIVYAFSLSRVHQVLKVGVVGAKSPARHLNQHYRPDSARSTLAGQLLASPGLYARLETRGLTEENVGMWLRSNTDRDFFRIRTSRRDLALMFESYLRLRVGALFENYSGKAIK